MRFLLDTSVIVDLLRQNRETIDFIKEKSDDEILTSSVCEAEIIAGIYYSKANISKMKEQKTAVFSSFYEVLLFDSIQADIFGQIKAQLKKSGEIIEDMDIMIAAAALASNSVLVTGNLKHFERIKNLQVITI